MFIVKVAVIFLLCFYHLYKQMSLQSFVIMLMVSLRAAITIHCMMISAVTRPDFTAPPHIDLSISVKTNPKWIYNLRFLFRWGSDEQFLTVLLLQQPTHVETSSFLSHLSPNSNTEPKTKPTSHGQTFSPSHLLNSPQLTWAAFLQPNLIWTTRTSFSSANLATLENFIFVSFLVHP